MQGNSDLCASAKLLNFTEKLKTASRECRLNMATRLPNRVCVAWVLFCKRNHKGHGLVFLFLN